MPSWPMTRPLNTDVTANDTPVTVPTMPLARSRRSSGTSSVTHVDMAMLRIIPATDPASVAPTRIQNQGASSWSSSSASTSTNTIAASPKHSADTERGQHHGGVLAVVVDVGAEGGADGRRRDAVGAADHAGGDDRAGLEVHPEGEGEPQEGAGDPRHQRVEQQLPERRPCPRWPGRPLILGRGRRAHGRHAAVDGAAMPHLIGGRRAESPGGGADEGGRRGRGHRWAGGGDRAVAGGLRRHGRRARRHADARRRRGRLRLGPARRAAGAPHPRLPGPHPRDPPRPLPRRARGAARRRRERGEHHAAVVPPDAPDLRARRRRPPGAELPAHDARVGAAALRAGRAERAVRGRRARRPGCSPTSARRRSTSAACGSRTGASCRPTWWSPAPAGATRVPGWFAEHGVDRRRGGAPHRHDLPVPLLPGGRRHRRADGLPGRSARRARLRGGRRRQRHLLRHARGRRRRRRAAHPPHGPRPLRGGAPAVPRDGAGGHPRRRADHRRCRRWAG